MRTCLWKNLSQVFPTGLNLLIFTLFENILLLIFFKTILNWGKTMNLIEGYQKSYGISNHEIGIPEMHI
jgi:hypothetical protein